jgi:DNA-binding MarR family transcriptional regulator
MAQLFVLNRLAEGKAMSLNELAARTLTHQSSVSVVVQRLIASGLVDSQVSQFDKRRVELRITEKGRRVLAKAPTAAQDRMIDALKKMPADRRKQLADGLNELVDLAGLARPFPGLFMEEDAAGIGAHRAGKNQKRVN